MNAKYLEIDVTLKRDRHITLASEQEIDLLLGRKIVAPIAHVGISPLSESPTRFPPHGQKFKEKRNSAYTRHQQVACLQRHIQTLRFSVSLSLSLVIGVTPVRGVLTEIDPHAPLVDNITESEAPTQEPRKVCFETGSLFGGNECGAQESFPSLHF